MRPTIFQLVQEAHKASIAELLTMEILVVVQNSKMSSHLAAGLDTQVALTLALHKQVDSFKTEWQQRQLEEAVVLVELAAAVVVALAEQEVLVAVRQPVAAELA
jgi:hypothetical protein